MKTEIWRVHNLGRCGGNWVTEDYEIDRLETQADTSLRVGGCCGQRGKAESQAEGNGTNRAGMHLVRFIFIGKLIWTSESFLLAQTYIVVVWGYAVI
jgi:hypothetical protein